MYKELCRRGAIKWTLHASQKMNKRKITADDVKAAIMTGETIKDYNDDKPYPSRLFLGENGLHVVASVGEGKLWIITAYWPSLEIWESDMKTRRKG